MNIQTCTTLDLLKDKGVCTENILKRVKKFFNNIDTFNLMQDALTKHTVKVSLINDIDILFCLCNFYEIYIYRNSFHFDLTDDGLAFKRIVYELNNIVNYKFIADIDNLNVIKVNTLQVIYNILERRYLNLRN